MDLFKLLGTIVVDNSKANKALDDTSQKGEQTKGKLSKAFSAVGKGAVAVGKTVGTGMLVAGAAMGGLTIKALSMAGDLEQNMGGSEAVFKDYAGKMQETAKAAFSNMGLSTNEFLGTANKMGALFQGAGFSIQESSELSAKSMQRAADVASIMGIDTSAAMEAIAGAAKGNFTMMDNLGVAMNDTQIQAYALSKGIKKSTTEMTQQEKIGLAMEMFLEKTSYAAGNYAKENETLAGSLGTAKSALKNFLDGSGSVDNLVTSFSNAAKVIVDNVKTLAPRLTKGLVDVTGHIIPMIPQLLSSLLPVIIDGAVTLMNGVVAAFPQIMRALLSIIPSLIQGFQQIITVLINALPQIMQTFVSSLPTLLPMIINALVQLIVLICTKIPDIIQPLIDALPDIIIAVVTALIQNLPLLITGLVQLVIGIVTALPQILSGIWEAITKLASTFTTKLFDKIKEWIRILFPKSADVIFKVFDSIRDFIAIWIDAIKGYFSVIFSIISIPFKLAWNAIEAVWSIAKAYFQMIWENIKAVFSVVDSVLSGDFKGAWEGIKKIWSNVKEFFSSCVDAVGKAFSNVGEILTAPFQKGADAVKKIVDSIKGFFNGVKLNFPEIKLPHFGINPKGWQIGDLLKGKIPKLSVDWYAKAMNSPMIMNKPTVFGYNARTGQPMAGGEAGSEVVSGTSTLMQMIQSAVSSQNESLVYYLQKLIGILAEYFPQILEAMDKDILFDDGALAGRLVPAIDRELGELYDARERGR